MAITTTYRTAIARADRDLNRALPGYHVQETDKSRRFAAVLTPDGRETFRAATAAVVWWVKGVCACREIVR